MNEADEQKCVVQFSLVAMSFLLFNLNSIGIKYEQTGQAEVEKWLTGRDLVERRGLHIHDLNLLLAVARSGRDFSIMGGCPLA